MARTCLAANGFGSLVFIDNMTKERSSWMNSEVFREMLSGQIPPKKITGNILESNHGMSEDKKKILQN